MSTVNGPNCSRSRTFQSENRQYAVLRIDAIHEQIEVGGATSGNWNSSFMQLTEATEGDIPVLVEYWYALAAGMEQYSAFNELAYDSTDSVPEDPFRALLDSDDTTVYLVEEDGDAIGFVVLRDGEHPSREYERYKSIVDLLITEEYRSQGYGSAVIEAVKELARADGCDHLKVSCEWANDDARRFYRDTGFEAKQVTFVQEIE